ncbi:MAG: sugar ABC transporter ATP-binding protein [Oscillospiraceae bacterium]
MDNEVLLKSKMINKSFGPTHAVADYNFEIRRGEVRGLIGENGSGKSTFTSIVAGVQQPDSGEMELLGKKYAPKTMLDAQKNGVAMIVQEMATISDITVAANIFAGKEKRFLNKLGFIDTKAMNREAQKILDEIGASGISPSANIETLSFEDRKVVEIARAMYDSPQLLIVDETTTALPQKGRDILYQVIKDMQAKNNAVIFISHDLEELVEVCNCVTVMRDGHLIKNLSKDEMQINRMRELMVGRELVGSYFRTDWDGSFGEKVVLRAENVTDGPLEEFSFELHEGEILGIGGLSECGIHEVGRVAFGIDKPITGKVTCEPSGVEIKNPQIAIDNSMGYVSKNRDKEALILNAPIENNIVLPSLKKLRKHGLIFPKDEKKLAQEQIKNLNIKCVSEKQYVMELSGGNKQKVVSAKWIGNDTQIFILDCPTRGIDIGVKKMMYDLLYELKKEGKSILIISEELPEVIGMSDRILILKDGHLSKEFFRSPDLTENDIIHYMV